MNSFQETIETWLSREAPERSVNHCFDIPIVLVTDIGLTRTQNQDRAAALRLSARSTSGRPLVAIAVADGMGGMRDGAECATLALSSFFFALTRYRSQDIERRATSAIAYANDEVFRFALGKGGATLSAVLLDQDLKPLICNLGDSRVYSFGNGAKVTRLTTDDSLAEITGGRGRELIQFVGMGEGMQPHIIAVPTEVKSLAVTTDGIHFLEAATLEDILTNAPGLKALAERLSALARWCGGNDNASAALIDLEALIKGMFDKDDKGIQIWDASGALSAIWINENSEIDRHYQLGNMSEPTTSVATQDPNSKQALGREYTRGKVISKKAKRASVSKKPVEKVQLDIQIEQSSSQEKQNDSE